MNLNELFNLYSKVSLYYSMMQTSANSLSLPSYASNLLIKKKLCTRSKSLIANSVKENNKSFYAAAIAELKADLLKTLETLSLIEEFYLIEETTVESTVETTVGTTEESHDNIKEDTHVTGE